MLFERTTLSKKPDEVIVQELRELREIDKLSPDLMKLGQPGIHVAEFLTLLPEKALLHQKLHDAVSRARMRLENRRVEDE